MVLHLFYPQVFRRPEVWRFDAELGWSHLADSAGRLVSPEYDVEIRINSMGLRDREYARGKPAGSRRIALFGDSFVEGWGMPIDRVLNRQLEICLQEGGERVEVANFGVAGYGTDQALLFFEQEGQRFDPDEVLLFFYSNDLWNNLRFLSVKRSETVLPVLQFFRFEVSKNNVIYIMYVINLVKILYF